MSLFNQINTSLGQAMQSPLFNMGIGLLANNTGHYGAFAPAFGAGVSQGMQQYNRNREMNMRAQYQQMLQQQMQRQIAQQLRNKQIIENMIGATDAYQGPPMDPSRAMSMARSQLLQNNPQVAMQRLLAQPKQPELPTGMIMGPNGPEWIPGYLEGQVRVRTAGAPKTSIKIGDTLSPGQEAMDKAYAKEVVGFETGGQYADTEKMLSELDEVYERLGSGENITGPDVGIIPDSLLSVINPAAVDTREVVEGVVQRNLKEILGAQFTEKEGERLISRAYNQRLDEATNKKRVGRLIAQMKSAYKAKQSAADYMRKHGTMKGWGGKLPSFQDFYDALEGKGEKEVWSIKRTR